MTEESKRACQKAMQRINALGVERWRYFRQTLNPYDFQHDRRVNRAYFKLWEILSCFPSIITRPAPRTLHLAEAPGSFVQVIKHRYPNAKCVAVSRPPTSQGIPAFSPHVRALTGVDLHYIDLLSENFIPSSGTKRFDFITADGGIDEQQRYDDKEHLHLGLILTQIIHILLMQAEHGGCILKLFDTSSTTTIHLLYLLAKHYTRCTFSKPLTSRPTNAERYFICTGFRGSSASTSKLLALNHKRVFKGDVLFSYIPPRFTSFVQRCSRDYLEAQAASINTVVDRITQGAPLDQRALYAAKQNAFTTWSQRFGFYEK